ncbi:L,D-transpeptidase [Chondrinema litorale]|uniref:L,D-transpeptidase n=1 Tax=Chondrinema litorale TaxID=2994555 RepID=UPI0025435892|nr:L,D-transpeptidase [Chondrinema litorale]UZR95512.1 L,D-transpeptidase [Chondrinema litorale]
MQTDNPNITSSLFNLTFVLVTFCCFIQPKATQAEEICINDSTTITLDQITTGSRAIRNLVDEMAKMPLDLKSFSQAFLDELVYNYNSLSAHQQQLLNKEAIFTGRILSKNLNPERFNLVHEKFKEQIEYVRNIKGYKQGYGLFVNAASKGKGGQRAYLINLRNGVILEVYCSTAWRGTGYNKDSDKTPLGFFLSTSGRVSYKENITMTGSVTDMFRKLQYQRWLSEAKYLHRVSTKKEKAYICSNQFALKGQNIGDEILPLKAVDDLYKGDTVAAKVNNSNSAERHLYVHGTNRVDQLGMNLSGGCVRVSNIFSFILQKVFYAQHEKIPVFIDYVKFKEGKDENPEDFEHLLEDLEDHEAVFESYRVISQVHFLNSIDIRNKIEDKVIREIVKIFKTGPDNVVKVKIAASLPFPETAMRDWLMVKDSLELLCLKPYRYNYDLFGNYRNSEDVVDPALKKSITVDKAREIVQARMNFTQQYIIKRLAVELKKHEIDYKDIEHNIQFELNPYKMKDFSGKEVFVGFDISDMRRKILRHVEYLDSLAKYASFTFIENEDLGWINSYIDSKVQIFPRYVGGKTYEDVVTYEDALLAQAYIYTIGEMALRKLAVYEGKILDEEDPEFYNIYRKDNYKFHQLIDSFGSKELLKYSRDPHIKGTGTLSGELKQNNQRILGIIRVSEKYLSGFKGETNVLKVEQLLISNEPVFITSR